METKTEGERTFKPNENQDVIDALENELQSIDETNFPQLHSLAQNELYKLRGGIADWLDVVNQKKVKIRTKVIIPVDNHPGFNFVGKLLGPAGSTLKGIQEQTMTKMAILGAGSVRNEEKEKELLESNDPKYQHLKQKLHLQIDSLAPPSEAFYRLSHALAEVKKYMTPDAGEFGGWGQEGFQQGSNPAARGGRGMFRGGRGGSGRGFGAPRGARGAPRGGRGRGAGGDFGATGNGMDGYNAASGYEQTSFDASAGSYDQYNQQTGYEQNFGTGYDQADPWGKARGSGRGQASRGMPYARPAGTGGAVANGSRPY